MAVEAAVDRAGDDADLAGLVDAAAAELPAGNRLADGGGGTQEPMQVHCLHAVAQDLLAKHRTSAPDGDPVCSTTPAAGHTIGGGGGGGSQGTRGAALGALQSGGSGDGAGVLLSTRLQADTYGGTGLDRSHVADARELAAAAASRQAGPGTLPGA